MILSIVDPLPLQFTFFESTPYYSPNSSLTIPCTSVPLPVPTLTICPHTEPPTRPLQVYSRGNRSTKTTLTAPPGLPPTAAPGNPSATPANDVPIALRKDGTLERYKACLVAKGFTQTYGVDYFETFSPVASLNSIRVLFSLAVNLNWPMYQMDIKNAFLYGDPNETVDMEQPPGYVAQGRKQRMVILAVYVDDILITGSDIVGIEEAKTYLQKHFVTKDLGRPKYFLGIEIAHSKHGISLSQRKYACYLLRKIGLLGTKPVDTPMDSNPDFLNDDGNYLEDKTKYRRLVGKLIYLTVTRPDISFVVGLVSQFMDKPRSVHWEAALRILKYIKSSPVARSSAKVEYRAMAHTISEILWLKNLLKELGFMYDDPIPMHCDNQAAIHIASNPIFHERTQHIEVDCHFVREAVMSQKICTPFTPSLEKRADIFTKALGGKQFDVLCNKLGIIDIFAPA
ncbi:UNVERIFIED_CONTAM: Retrovirus-related Pol polyprotein from transposon RE2 [Sesamum angustifolium]|uniref:Retrovirus-related Pol polyprotein from transposon RE2 n=1 Tax=Sesamum angustifolium TaxID=2727405 RepID=A0AAW2Q8Q4_9LAMI